MQPKAVRRGWIGDKCRFFYVDFVFHLNVGPHIRDFAYIVFKQIAQLHPFARLSIIVNVDYCCKIDLVIVMMTVQQRGLINQLKCWLYIVNCCHRE